jgi:hypothetical protein
MALRPRGSAASGACVAFGYFQRPYTAQEGLEDFFIPTYVFEIAYGLMTARLTAC